MGKTWPRVYYVAERNMSKCVHCGTCATRCYVDAFRLGERTTEVDRRVRTVVDFDAQECRGCGICATACPEGAITMKPMHEAVEEKEAA